MVENCTTIATETLMARPESPLPYAQNRDDVSPGTIARHNIEARTCRDGLLAMFDFGFWELILVMLVGLIVVGPKRLPRVAAQVGEWLGNLRRLSHQFRQSVQQELQAEELKEVLRQQQNEIKELRDIVQNQDDSDAPLVDAIEKQLEERGDVQSEAPARERAAPRREEN